MKIRHYLAILFEALAIVVLLGLAGFMTLYIADDSMPLKQQIMEFLHIRKEPASEPAASESAPESETLTAVKEHSFVFVGDSRTLGMRDAVNDDCTYIGAEGEGYDWYVSEGATLLTRTLETNPTGKVIFNLGVNDPAKINLYVETYQSLMSQYPDTPFYFLSVNPMVDSKDYNTTNEMIELFNATLESAFPDAYLDCYTYLTDKGFETVDGLHYTDETYQDIHNFVVDKLA